MRNRRYKNKVLNIDFKTAIACEECTKRIRKEVRKINRKGYYKKNKLRNIWDKIDRRNIVELDLSRELYNSLINNGIKTVGDLIRVLETEDFNIDIINEFGYDEKELTPAEEDEIEYKYYKEAYDKICSKLHMTHNGYCFVLDKEYYKL